MAALPSFETLVTPFLPELKRFCYYLTKSKWDADDLYQEALLKSLTYYLNAEKKQVTKSFLFGAAKLIWIDHYRSKARKTGFVMERPEGYTESDYAEIRSIVEWLAELLPERNIEIWLLAEYFGYSMQDIANRMNTTVSSVKSALYRSREWLRAESAGRRAGRSRKAGKEPLQIERWVHAVMLEQPERMCGIR